MTLDEAEQWPDLIAIVREKVKPERDNNKRDARRGYWWRFGEVAPALYEAIANLDRCLVTSIVSKHLIFSFQPTSRIFSHKLCAFSLSSYSSFAVLQSRVHGPWTWLLSSTMKNDLNYSASDCFETFPFSQPNPRTNIANVEAVGERLYNERAQYMIETNHGLTQTYNRLKDPKCDEPRVLHLRELHKAMDRAVLEAYGWGDLIVPPFCPLNVAEQRELERFLDTIIDRLFVLNAQRAEEEKRLGAAKSGKANPSSKRGSKRKGQSTVPQSQLSFDTAPGEE
jgi:hypothetical protein